MDQTLPVGTVIEQINRKSVKSVGDARRPWSRDAISSMSVTAGFIGM